MVKFENIRRFQVANTVTFVEVDTLERSVLYSIMRENATAHDRAAFRINCLWITVFRAMEYMSQHGHWPSVGGEASKAPAVNGESGSFLKLRRVGASTAYDGPSASLTKSQPVSMASQSDINRLFNMYTRLESRIESIAKAVGAADVQPGAVRLSALRGPPEALVAGSAIATKPRT